MNSPPDFSAALKGRFLGILSWPHLRELWTAVRARADGWYLYALGEDAPSEPCSGADVVKFLSAVEALLRAEIRDGSCGVVYTDSKEHPTLIKIYDPHRLGSACAGGGAPPLPGWIMSRLPPEPLQPDRIVPENRRRWWRELWR